jgi:hypothetical protein
VVALVVEIVAVQRDAAPCVNVTVPVGNTSGVPAAGACTVTVRDTDWLTYEEAGAVSILAVAGVTVSEIAVEVAPLKFASPLLYVATIE